jgi:hypothetical protein
MLALCQAPERVEGKDLRETSAKTTGFATHMLAFSQAPEHVEGGGKHEEGGGSARLIADDCLKYLFI